MSGIFCSKKAATDEEYRKITKRRMVQQVILILVGIATLAINEYARHKGISNIPEFGQGILSGSGSGLIGAGVLFLIKSLGLLKDEKKLRAARIEEADERNIFINSESIKVAMIVLIAAMYIVFILSIFMTMNMTMVMAGLIMVFIIAYLMAMIVCSKIM